MAGASLTASERAGFDSILTGVLEEVRSEVLRAIEKHGHEAMAMPGHDVGKRLGILGEELGEVSEEIVGDLFRFGALAASYGKIARATTYDNSSDANLLTELVQTAAMAVSWKVAAEFEKSGKQQQSA